MSGPSDNPGSDESYDLDGDPAESDVGDSVESDAGDSAGSDGDGESAFVELFPQEDDLRDPDDDAEGDTFEEDSSPFPGGVTGRAMSVLGGPQERSWMEPATDYPDADTVREEVIQNVIDYYEEQEDDDRLAVPDEDFIRDRFFDFSYLDRYEEVERTWVNEPYAYVSILFDPHERQHRYWVTEPELNDFEEYVRRDVTQHLRNSLPYRSIQSLGEKERIFEQEVVDEVIHHTRTVDERSLRKILYYLRRDFLEFGPVDPVFQDPAIEDVSCDGVGIPVFVFHRKHRDLETNITFDESSLTSYVVRLAQRADEQISMADPLTNATLPDGSRLELTLGGEVSDRGANFTVRKFSDVPFSPVDLIRLDTFSVEQMAYFWLAIENNRSLIFCGGTGSGKTTSLNAVSFFIPGDSKIVSIEDTREIDLPHKNWIQSVTRESTRGGEDTGIEMYDLLRSALRHRPEYLLVGEIRTEQRVALTFFQAMATGHTAYTTVHAESVQAALNRLQNPPLSVPSIMVRDLDILSIQRQVHVGDQRVRRNWRVAEVVGRTPEGGIKTNNVFRRDPTTDTHEKVGDSQVLPEVATERGWNRTRLEREVSRREMVLRFLLDQEHADYRDVSAVTKLYNRDPEFVLDRIRSQGYEV